MSQSAGVIHQGTISELRAGLASQACIRPALHHLPSLHAQGKSDVARIAVLGASGYTGAEVVRLCALHPYLKVTALTGDKQAGKVRPPHSRCPSLQTTDS